MNLLVLLAASILLYLTGAEVKADESATVRNVLHQLATEHSFEIQGADKLGNELVPLSRVGADADYAVSRALARYNYVIRYADQRVRVVEVLGRKGTDPGPMPDNLEAEADVPQE